MRKNTFRKPVRIMVYLVEEFVDSVVSISAKKDFYLTSL